MTDATIPALVPGERLLCGPGPSNVHPAVLEAMQLPMNGHLDPDFWDILVDLVTGLRSLWRRPQGGLTIALSSSGTSAMEAGFMNLVDPGDTVISCHWGFFGSRLNEFAQRVGANVIELTAELGQVVTVDRIMEALAAHPDAKIVSVVHAETSTGADFPLAALAEAMRSSDSEALLYADCVTSLGGQQVDADAWGIDYGYSCSQKALGCPPGIAPVTVSGRAVAAMQRHQSAVPYYYDFEELSKYWIDRPITYHHTMPILQYYALYTGIRLALEEGLEARWARNADAGRYFQDEIRSRGFELLADPDHQLVELTAVKVPEGVDGKEIQGRMLREHGIEVGGGLGPKAPPIWRVGLMGVNATRETADRVLGAFDAVLPR
ncbi:MAG: aminotransferase class V-fold PLP-dependent enzyme [Actinomycetota bacterium]|nr:aminotransferase class V-fold PLP-dependent enzyme [Actinomycetota bacterium]MDH5224363.1 aminotransferase class V-fold PLP-dependent enzyme [Actinomycetota bacterium]MDH5313196.1 aminotransferase class V-fold PLP-dependent enzyme [Actinomycetota bacterium]